jgi:hypothetical protein
MRLPLGRRVAYTGQEKWRAAPAGAAGHGSPPKAADLKGGT